MTLQGLYPVKEDCWIAGSTLTAVLIKFVLHINHTNVIVILIEMPDDTKLHNEKYVIE